ncbi:putative ArsR family transcriptional regulator [Thiomonas arsenitoxydans]|uniref:ArsR family transcriptional regulator n=2 Tax=Thiomonas TaxID=32012 RepID=D6CMI1_THIA3|nr:MULTISPECIES: metalloregulator ArsR/SmtB family transcription factor [Thiomonas]CQR42388.1 putative ArsR family transcriptional regulator [Thiomonas sp. CB3]CAZ89759.1 putative ArsR family transcriptional regulator [Thiomonas arsenitoxydans]CQR31563.1 putative ArsR family transcriptional regulator [Thiomonas arsenitoxydans]CQR36320.1 putative ArsR family transcriptional regulator [Thiomonas arsenitoxydans]CQR39376.1 putative ArsR family transcriptional regulator [Thiomonas arsenitoxydans]
MHHELPFSSGADRRARATGKLRSTDEDDVAAVFEAAAELFAALSSPMRLSIVCHLREQDMNVQQIANRIGSSQPNTSLHLRQLHQIGIVDRSRSGQSVTYRIRNTFVADLCKIVCPGH